MGRGIIALGRPRGSLALQVRTARHPILYVQEPLRKFFRPYSISVDAALPQPRYGTITLFVNLLTHSPVDHLPSQPEIE